jgi:hypothetical protein
MLSMIVLMEKRGTDGPRGRQIVDNSTLSGR